MGYTVSRGNAVRIRVLVDEECADLSQDSLLPVLARSVNISVVLPVSALGALGS